MILERELKKYMRKLTNIGFSRVEITVGLCAILVLLAIGVKSLSDNANSGSYSMFKKQAENFAYRVGIFKDMYPSEEGIYYLDDLLDNKYGSEIKNPFNKTVECDRYESYVKIINGAKHVNFKCGNYLAVGIEGKTFSIYELSDWRSDETDAGESQVLYNYKKNNVFVGDHFMIEKEFMDFFNAHEFTDYSSVFDIDDEDIEVVSNKLYRDKIFVKEI